MKANSYIFIKNYGHRIIRNSTIIIILLIAGLSCSSPTGPEKREVNPNIIEIKYSDPLQVTNYFMGVWRNNKVFSVVPLIIFTLDNDCKALSNTKSKATGMPGRAYWRYMEANEAGTKLLLVNSEYSDVCSGSLYEYDVTAEEIKLLKDESNSVSSAKYLHGNDTKLIYYKYGDLYNNGAGYYLFDKATNKDSLIFTYHSAVGRGERLNCFDIHPNNKKLLLGLNTCVGFNSSPPLLCEYDFQKQKIDTLNIKFVLSRTRTGLWVRYNGDATKVLYSCFPTGIYTDTVSDESEVGIIELPSLQKKVLDINTNSNKNYGSVQLAPNWSPNYDKIVFGSGQVLPDGAVGTRKLFILKNIN